MRPALRAEAFSALPGWAEDRPVGAFAAFCRSALRALETTPYKTGSLGLSHADFEPGFRAALELGKARGRPVDDVEARDFFTTWFRPFEVLTGDGGADGDGFVTGYYEPEIAVRSLADAEYAYPFLRRPANLVKVPDPDNPPDGVPKGHAFMLLENGVPRSCPDRGEIETGSLDGTDLPSHGHHPARRSFLPRCKAAPDWYIPTGEEHASPMMQRAGTRSPVSGNCWLTAARLMPTAFQWQAFGTGLREIPTAPMR